MRRHSFVWLLFVFLCLSAPTLVGLASAAVPDADEDGIADAVDNCRQVPNASQRDSDFDGLGDACDPDRDGDGVMNVFDNCPTFPNAEQLDSNADGVGEACESVQMAAREEP
ncbi:MAG: thrombospondin type 3 repeat-containing protein [Myxococcota bacterium]|nr:thrombospondin type 3 repeat-containing protein [Myxococcota bacterium]